jgi:hypothetical protein
MIIYLPRNILVFKNSENNGRIPLVLLSEKQQNLPINLTLLCKFEEKFDGCIRNFIVFYELHYAIQSKQSKTISIIKQLLKAH